MAENLSYSQELGVRVKALRKQLDLSQATLADRCGVFRTYISQIEAGIANPTLDTLVNLSTALEVEVWDLMYV